MIDDSRIDQIIKELAQADEDNKHIPLLTGRWPEMTVEDAYKVQGAWRKQEEAKGRVVAGHKIGLTSRAMQLATGIDEPDYGIIFRDRIYDNGVNLEWESILVPRIEVELAFTLTKDLKGPNVSFTDTLDAIGWVVPALEILGSHIELQGRTIVDTISDNAAMHSMVLGGRPVRLNDVDLRWTGAILYVNQQIEETGLGAGVLNHPAAGVMWLANKLAAHDDGLSAGETILAGSFTRPVAVQKGDSVIADYGPLGTVTCNFH